MGIKEYRATGGNAALLKKATALRSGLSCYNHVLPYFLSP